MQSYTKNNKKQEFLYEKRLQSEPFSEKSTLIISVDVSIAVLVISGEQLFSELVPIDESSQRGADEFGIMLLGLLFSKRQWIMKGFKPDRTSVSSFVKTVHCYKKIEYERMNMNENGSY